MKSHDKTHGYPAGYMPIPGEENIHGDSRMKQGTTKAVTAGRSSGFSTGKDGMRRGTGESVSAGNAHGFGHTSSQKEGPLRNSGVKGAHRIGRTRGK
jgi:hypothetical protein